MASHVRGCGATLAPMHVRSRENRNRFGRVESVLTGGDWTLVVWDDDPTGEPVAVWSESLEREPDIVTRIGELAEVEARPA